MLIYLVDSGDPIGWAQAASWLSARGGKVLRAEATSTDEVTREDLAAILHIVTQHAECVALPIGWADDPRAVSIHATAKSIGISVLLMPALDNWVPALGT
jgi:hypothetical protein